MSILLGGGANFFFFSQASSLATERQILLREKLGTDFARKMGPMTIVTYL